MNKFEFPIRPDQITAPWLTTVLREHGLLGRGRVADVRVEMLTDPGQTAEIYRLFLDYAGDAGDAPRSLVAKLPASFADARAVAHEYDLYQREVRFYLELAAGRDLPVPRAYAAHADPASGEFILLLEDLGDARRGSLFRSQVADVKAALGQLARIHAEFWNDPGLAELDFVRDLHEPEWNAKLKGLVEELVPAAHALFTDQFSPSALKALDTWLRLWDDLLGYAPDADTLVHGDAHPQQMFFATEQAPRFALFDWQSATLSWGANDVARLLVTGLSVDDRRLHERALVDHYHAELCKRGVADLDKSRLWLQIAVGHVWNFCNNAVGALQTDTANLAAIAQAEGADWRECILGRVGAAFDDWRVGEALEVFAAEARGARTAHEHAA